MTSSIVHIPSWFPSNHSVYSGVFIKKQIEAINSFDNYKHIVLTWQDTAPALLRNPLSFIKSIINLFRKDETWVEDSIVYYRFHYFYTDILLFGNNDKRLYKRVKKIIEKFQINNKVEFIHAHVTYPGGYVAEKLKHDLKLPYIISEHMSPFPFVSLLDSLSDKIISPIRNAEVTIAVSKDLAGDIKRITEKDAVVIPNVVDEREFNLKEDIKVKAKFEFLIIGLLTRQKGIDILLHAVKLIVEKGSFDFVVRIGGSGEIVNELKEMVKELHIENYIVWLGEISRERLPEAYLKCDAFISASRHESFGVVIVEALACGKPVIATKSGGPEDIINSTNGILVEKENINALAYGMEWMMRNMNQFDSSKIREDYLRKYSRKVIAEAYHKIYDEIIK